MLLEVHQLRKTFGGLTAVGGVSFGVPEGSVAGLIGPNGAGKTTVFNLIAGSIRPSGGTVKFAGDDITAAPSHRVCRLGIARTFQIARPFGTLSVLENVVIGAFARATEQQGAYRVAEETIAAIGLERWRDVSAQSLPIGLRKRVEVARALATRPRLLLLDEVMSGLNPTELRGMIDLIRGLQASGITVLLIEHVMAAVMILCDRIAVIHHGEKIGEGTPSEVARDAKVIEAYLGEEYLIE